MTTKKPNPTTPQFNLRTTLNGNEFGSQALYDPLLKCIVQLTRWDIIKHLILNFWKKNPVEIFLHLTASNDAIYHIMSGVEDNFYREEIPLMESANQRRRREATDAKVLRAAGISLGARGIDLERTLAEGLVNKEAVYSDAPIPYESKQIPPDIDEEDREWVMRQEAKEKEIDITKLPVIEYKEFK